LNYYETLYIVHSALESGRLKDIILSLEESLKKLGGKTLSIDLWGKKRLAYLIDKQKYGTYVQIQFSAEGNCISSFGMELEHNPNVLSYLTTLIEESDVVSKEKNLDTQIAGHSREAQVINQSSEKGANKDDSKDGQSTSSSNEEDLTSKNNVDDGNDKSEKEEVELSEQSAESINENQENADETTAESE
tara:strand:- start:291 stop:860 length:570 start_codon:yes stop_codon:yes gene_type:complete